MKQITALTLKFITLSLVAFTAQAQTYPVQEIKEIFEFHANRDPSVAELQGLFSGYCYVPKSCDANETKFKRVPFAMANFFLAPDQDLPAPSVDHLKSIPFTDSEVFEGNINRKFVINSSMSLVSRDASALKRMSRRYLHSNLYEVILTSSTTDSPGSTPSEVRTYHGLPIVKNIRKCDTGTTHVYCVNYVKY